MNIIKSNDKMLKNILSAYITPKTTAVDCTLGNGYDSLWLLQSGVKKLYAFDIQEIAISNSKRLLTKEFNQNLENVHLILDSHENLAKYISSADLFIFNLGYLPKGDKSITTEKASTLKAISIALKKLSVNGICAITAYSGHIMGALEKEKIVEFLQDLDGSIFHVAYINLLNQKNNPPEVFLITRKK